MQQRLCDQHRVGPRRVVRHRLHDQRRVGPRRIVRQRLRDQRRVGLKEAKNQIGFSSFLMSSVKQIFSRVADKKTLL